MRFFLTVLGLSLIFVSVVHAETQMSSGIDYGSYTITGDEGYFDVYLRFPSSGVSVAAYQDSWVEVTDLGVNVNQNHLFKVAGLNGDLFQITGGEWAAEVLDSSMSRIGVYSGELDPVFHADAGGPYTIGPGQSVTLDAGLSYLAKNWGWNPGSNSLVSPDSIDRTDWKIDGIAVGSIVSFDTLVNDLGLSYGMHTVSLNATAAWLIEYPIEYQIEPCVYLLDGSAVSTIEIVPEPTTIGILALGGIFIRKAKGKT